MPEVDQGQAQKPQPSDLDPERAWRYLQHADTLQYARQNFSMVAESMLVVAFFTVPAGVPGPQFRLAIAFLGAVYTLAWLYLGWRLAARMEPLHHCLKAKDPVYKVYLEAVPKHPAGKLVLVWLLPLVTLGFWVFLLWKTIKGL